MPFQVIGISHHTAPVDLREQFAITPAQLPGALEDLRRHSQVEELVILSTCNRVELYAVFEGREGDAVKRLRQVLARNRNYLGDLESCTYAHAGRQGLRHLFRVASGLDSMILGETEILGQVKQAYQAALQHGHSGRRLNRIFQKAFQVAKLVRSRTSIQRGPTSVAAAAVELAERIFDGLDDHQVMILGAGDTSEKTARALLSRGAGSILVSNRSHDHAARLAAKLGGRAIRFDEWAREFSRIDIVISSTASPRYFLDTAHFHRLMQHRPARPLLLIDIAVPRDIDPLVGLMDNIYLYNIDDLQSLAENQRRMREREIDRCEVLIKNGIDETLSRLSRSSISMICSLLPGRKGPGRVSD